MLDLIFRIQSTRINIYDSMPSFANIDNFDTQRFWKQTTKSAYNSSSLAKGLNPRLAEMSPTTMNVK